MSTSRMWTRHWGRLTGVSLKGLRDEKRPGVIPYWAVRVIMGCFV